MNQNIFYCTTKTLRRDFPDITKEPQNSFHLHNSETETLEKNEKEQIILVYVKWY